jgi:hypothetical protein
MKRHRVIGIDFDTHATILGKEMFPVDGVQSPDNVSRKPFSFLTVDLFSDYI